MELTITVAGKLALRAVTPRLSALVDFGKAVYDLGQGDVAGFVINTASGVVEVVTCGVSGVVKDAMAKSAKQTVVETSIEAAKKVKKEATKKVGQELGKQLATGVIMKGGKGAAIQTVKAAASTAAKDACKGVGQQASREIARGVIGDAVEQVFQQGTKLSIENLPRKLIMEVISSGGHQVTESCTVGLFYDLLTGTLEKATKQSGQKFVFKLTKDAAIKGAEVGFKKEFWHFFAKEAALSSLKGGTRWFFWSDNDALKSYSCPIDPERFESRFDSRVESRFVKSS